MSANGIYEAWSLPGCPEQEGTITATEAKPIGAYIIIAGPVRKFRIWHDERSFDNRGCWRIDEHTMYGTTTTSSYWEPLAERSTLNGAEYSTLREAKSVARKLARGAK